MTPWTEWILGALGVAFLIGGRILVVSGWWVYALRIPTLPILFMTSLGVGDRLIRPLVRVAIRQALLFDVPSFQRSQEIRRVAASEMHAAPIIEMKLRIPWGGECCA